MHVHWSPVSSSVIARARYDAETSSLDITFQSGKIYRYARVPAGVYEDLLAANSKGTFFNDQIRGRFEYAEIDA